MICQSEAMLGPTGALVLRPSAVYRDCDRLALRLWCHHFARYGLPTVELIAWLRDLIGGRSAIEIGAGSGDLCHHLDIPGFDNFQQDWPDVRAYYQALHQPTIRYGAWVQKMDALEAVRTVKPDVCIGSWVTHWIDPSKPVPPGGGNMYGIKEEELLDLVDTYVVIGNLAVHGQKPIMRFSHEELQFDFVQSRAARPELDRIFVWRR